MKLWTFVAVVNGWTIQMDVLTGNYRLAAFGHILDPKPNITVEGMMTTLAEAYLMAKQQHPSECG